MSGARSSSFYWAMRLMPQAQRRAMFAVYGWCRAGDDIADADLSVESRRAGLVAMRRDLDRIFEEGDGSALSDAIRRYRLERVWFEMVLDGLDSDVESPLSAPDMATLDLYCQRVAGAVGRIAVGIFGLHDEAAGRFAFAAGHALQLTNILRDIAEDAARDRLYLPREALAEAGIGETAPLAVSRHPALPRATEWLAGRARTLYAEAEAEARLTDRRKLWPGLAMLRLYRRLLDRMPAEKRPRLGTIEALRIVLACRFGLGR
jgi:phytoene/squalene synthetase